MTLTTQQQTIIANRHKAKKIKLEAAFIAALLRLFRRIARDLVRVYKENKVLSASQHQNEFTKLLQSQYNKINKHVTLKYIDATFNNSKTIEQNAFNDFERQILQIITARLALILATTQRDIDRIVNKVKASDNPQNYSLLKQLFLASTLYRARLIAVTETQNGFEAKKQTISDQVLRQNGELLNKTWLTIMDGKERPWHGEAFGQTVKSNMLFTVGGEKLAHPGDTTHGATPSNICKCRCSAIFENGLIIRGPNAPI